MFFEIISAVCLGIATGIITGITPGVHVNLVATTLLAASSFLLGICSPVSLASFLMALAVTHSSLDTIPSIYLGAPDDENALSVLPGQKMLLQGEGYQAVKLTILGTYIGLLVAITLIPLFMLTAKILYPLLKPYLAFLLIAIISFMVIREKQRFWSALLFFSSGILGAIVFSIPNNKEPLFPLLSGLFGISGLLISYFENTKIPLQKITSKIEIRFKELAKVLFGSSLAVFIIQFFPGMGPAQGAVISNQIIRDIKDKSYLAMIGAMGTMSVVFSLVTFYTLNKAKDGSIVVMSKLLQISLQAFIVLILSFLVAGSISVFLTLWLAKRFSKIIVKVNYKLLVVMIIAFIIIMCIILSGPLGLLIIVTSTAIGLIAPLKGIARNHAMGCLILPVILYLLL